MLPTFSCFREYLVDHHESNFDLCCICLGRRHVCRWLSSLVNIKSYSFVLFTFPVLADFLYLFWRSPMVVKPKALPRCSNKAFDDCNDQLLSVMGTEDGKNCIGRDVSYTFLLFFLPSFIYILNFQDVAKCMFDLLSVGCQACYCSRFGFQSLLECQRAYH